MFTRSEILQNGEFFHVFNRGVDKEAIFIDDRDRNRFISSIEKFKRNNVRIMAFCLMNNHYHLLLEQLGDNGISLFMQKLGIGYTMYFNKRHDRSDSLFGSRYKFTHIKNEAHFLHISRYIHLNPVELVKNAYSKSGIFDRNHIGPFLYHYKWSSYSSYLDAVYPYKFIEPEKVLSCFSSNDDYQNFVLDWVFL